MTNHVHVIAVPAEEDSFKRLFKEVHVRYTRRINFRKKWRGCLWQGRYKSYPMDNRYLIAAARYIELNPVKAKIVQKPWEYPWSSAQAHLSGKDDGLVEVRPLLDMVGDWKEFLESGMPREEEAAIEKHMKTGLPLGAEEFIEALEKTLQRCLRPKKPGPKPKSNGGLGK